MRLQLTIVAKYIFLQSESENSFEIDAETNLNFLKLARHITSNGLIPLRNNLECIVSEILTKFFKIPFLLFFFSSLLNFSLPLQLPNWI